MILHPLTATVRLPYIPLHCDQNRYSSLRCMQKSFFALTERIGITGYFLCFLDGLGDADSLQESFFLPPLVSNFTKLLLNQALTPHKEACIKTSFKI